MSLYEMIILSCGLGSDRSIMDHVRNKKKSFIKKHINPDHQKKTFRFKVHELTCAFIIIDEFTCDVTLIEEHNQVQPYR